MEDSKKPSLDQVIKKLEELNIHEWKREDNSSGRRLVAQIGYLKFYVFKWEKYHQISISDLDAKLYVEYYDTKKDSDEEKKISEFYTKICKEHEEYKKKEFGDAVEQFFSD